MSVTGLMNKAASVYAITINDGADGSQSTTYGSAKTCACALQPLSAREAQVHGRPTGVVLYRIYVPFTFDDGTAMAIAKTAKVVVGSDEYRVVSPLRNEGGRDVFYSADLEAWK